MADGFLGVLSNLKKRLVDHYDGTVSERLNVINAAVCFRDAFEEFTPGERWNVTVQDPADIVMLDGNSASASYLVISKDPFSLGTSTVIETVESFEVPFRVGVGLSLSQRVQGQECSVEAVSADEDPPPISAPVAISSIQQATTTLTVNTATPHGLVPGDRVCISGVSDSRMNYAQLVVATIPTPSQFTATAGPMGTIPSVTAGPFTSGQVSRRPAMNSAVNGTSMIFENTTVTNASIYARSESGALLPSGTIAGNHAVTVATTASVQLLNTTAAYAFGPTSQYEVFMHPEAVQWVDGAVDSTTTFTSRIKRTQVVPNPKRKYKVRLRAVNLAGLSSPVAQIQSSAKSGTTTATITTATPHGLTTGDQVVIYGNRDQTNFANLTTATAVASVIDATHFTIAYGASTTATTYGGFVARVNGGQAVPGLIAQVAQSITRTSNVVTVVGSGTWSGALIGDYVNLVGVRDNSTGASLGIDGAYRVRDMSTTNLVLEPIGNTPTGADIGSTNCGGAVIKRTDLRIHFARVTKFSQVIVESVGGFNRGDSAGSFGVYINGSTTLTANVAGQQADNSSTIPNSVMVGGKAQSALPTTATSGRLMSFLATLVGALITKPFSIPELDWTYTGSITVTTDTPAKAAGAAGIRNYVTAAQFQNTGASATTVSIKDGASTVLWQVSLPASMASPFSVDFPTPLKGTAATALNVTCGTASTLLANVQGYQAP